MTRSNSGDYLRVLCSTSWHGDTRRARCANRSAIMPGYRTVYYGLRPVAKAKPKPEGGKP